MTHACQYPAILAILRADYPDAVHEHKFHPVRDWRFDFAILSARLAIEINGGIWTKGRHARGSGLIKEYEKMRAAAILGWRVMPFAVEELSRIRMEVWAAVHHRDEEPTDHHHRRKSALERK